MYENAFNGIERDLRAEEGIANELDYVEQISWVLFLEYLHDLKTGRRDQAQLEGKSCSPIIEGAYARDIGLIAAGVSRPSPSFSPISSFNDSSSAA